MRAIIRSTGIAVAMATVATLLAAAFTQPIRAVSAEEAHAGTPATIGHSIPGHDPSGAAPGQMPGMMQQRGPQMMEMHAKHAAQMGSASANMPGQDAFGAIQEIVGKLEADPTTDWSKVNLEALRQHLVDMNEVTLRADVATKPIDGGLEISVTVSGRTLAAIQRMVPAHAQEMNGVNSWSVKSAPTANGVLLTVVSSDPKEVQHIRGLGFIGILVSSSHHQPHHLAMAKGEFSHTH